MIAFRKAQGAPLRLRLTSAMDLTGVEIASSLRSDLGAEWPLAVTVEDPASAGVFELDAGVNARALPEGRLWFDIRFMRGGYIVQTLTFGLYLLTDLDAANAALMARATFAARGAVEGRVYLTAEGEMLDQICARELGSDALAPQVLGAHPRLAELGPVYPAGLALFLPSPDRVTPATAPRITLWGRA
ncbi:tail protein X [Roseinatronobacter sp.]|uniref:tail protein X n=1 Tax=Roseinatronobacter sp. TaxID=1945755 RepID=UPI0025E1D83C|nr:tail protein X [Roseibaca sp.]